MDIKCNGEELKFICAGISCYIMYCKTYLGIMLLLYHAQLGATCIQHSMLMNAENFELL